MIDIFVDIVAVAYVVLRQREHTHREFNPATDMNYSSSSPSLQKGEGQLIPSLTFVQRYECLRECLWTPLSLHSRAYFNPPHLTQSRTLALEDRIPDIYSNYDYYNYLHK